MAKIIDWIYENCRFALATKSTKEHRYAESVVPTQTPVAPVSTPEAKPSDRVVVTLPRPEKQEQTKPEPKPGEMWMTKPASAWIKAKEGKPSGWAGFVGQNDYPRPCYVKDVSGDFVLAMPISTQFQYAKKSDIQLLPSDPDFRQTGLQKPSLLKPLSATVLNKADFSHRIGTLPASKRTSVR